MENEPAFPTDSAAQVGPQTWHYEGLTKLEYFAGLTLQAIITQGQYFQNGPTMAGDMAADAVNLAKALLAALEKESSAKG